MLNTKSQSDSIYFYFLPMWHVKQSRDKLWR